MIFRTLSREIRIFSASTSFSCARVGPKSEYFFLTRSRACCTTSASRRWLLACPRFALTRPFAACFRYFRHSRFTCRTLSPSSVAASFCSSRFSFNRCITSSRVNSFALIASISSIVCPFKRGHYHFAQRGHYHFAITCGSTGVYFLKEGVYTRMFDICHAGQFLVELGN